MKLLIQIDKPAILEGVPPGVATVEIEVESPADVHFQMHRRGCSKEYILDVINHLYPVWSEQFAHWYGRPDPVRISKDLQEVHPAYGFTERY
jgi:hypothetical protein